MGLDFQDEVNTAPQDPNIDSSLTLNPPTGLTSPIHYQVPHASTLPNIESTPVIPGSSFTILTQSSPTELPQSDPSHQRPAQTQAQAHGQRYTPAKLFQATGDVRNLSRSVTSPSGFVVQIYDRHLRIWVSDINFLDIAIRGQLYILWKTSWQEHAVPPLPVDRDMVFDAAALTLAEIQKDHNKWERNYSAARRRDWHPNFTSFYDDIFKGFWPQRIWPSPQNLPEPPRFLAEMARRLAKGGSAAAGMNIHESEPVIGDINGDAARMSPVALRTLKLRVIELEAINQGLREELSLSPLTSEPMILENSEGRALLIHESNELKSCLDQIRQQVNSA
jgi:hypothetical protein